MKVLATYTVETWELNSLDPERLVALEMDFYGRSCLYLD